MSDCQASLCSQGRHGIHQSQPNCLTRQTIQPQNDYEWFCEIHLGDKSWRENSDGLSRTEKWNYLQYERFEKLAINQSSLVIQCERNFFYRRRWTSSHWSFSLVTRGGWYLSFWGILWTPNMTLVIPQAFILCPSLYTNILNANWIPTSLSCTLCCQTKTLNIAYMLSITMLAIVIVRVTVCSIQCLKFLHHSMCLKFI